MEFYIKQGDTLPIFAVQLLDDNGNPIDLAGCIVKLWIDGMDGFPKEMTIYGDGIVAYKFTTTDTLKIGTYLAEIQIAYNNGDIITLPTIGNIKIHVYDTLREVI